MLDKIKRFYELHIYTAAQVWRFADRGAITPEQAEQIAGPRP